MATSIAAGFLRNEKDDRARVACGVAGVSRLANPPLPPNLERDYLHVARSDIGHRHDSYLAGRLRSYVLGDALHPRDRVGLQHVSEIVHQPGRGRDLNALGEKEEPGCSQRGKQRRRRKPDQNRGKYLLSHS